MNSGFFISIGFYGTELFEIRDNVLYTHSYISGGAKNNIKALISGIYKQPKKFGTFAAAKDWFNNGVSKGTIIKYTEEALFLELL